MADNSHLENYALPSTQLEMMELDTLANNKWKRRMVTPLDVSEVRRSVRATRYQGFKPPSMADNKRRPSCVKSRKTPDILELQHGNSTDATYASTHVPPPTAIETLQYLGTTHCAIPHEDITREKLLAPLKGKNLDEA